MQKGKHIIGKVNLKSSLDITELGRIISDNVLAGVILDGLEEKFYDEVPAIFAQNSLLGFNIVLQGYSGFDNESGFSFRIIPAHSEKTLEKEIYDLSSYLISLFKSEISNQNIIILDEMVL